MVAVAEGGDAAGPARHTRRHRARIRGALANFIDALLYIDSQSLYTLPLGLRLLQPLNPTDFPLLMAGAVIATAPPVAVFLLAQRIFFDDPLRSLRGGRS